MLYTGRAARGVPASAIPPTLLLFHYAIRYTARQKEKPLEKKKGIKKGISLGETFGILDKIPC